MAGAKRTRLDRELVRRGLARSREHATELVEAGAVTVRGMVAVKTTTAVGADDPVLVSETPASRWVSRGAHKLLGALDAWRGAEPPLDPAGLRCLDAGASTGGFTQVLLEAGAREVLAVDVGYGQLAWSLQTDDRVVVHDRTNVRELTPEHLGGPVDLTVADLSFIGLHLVLPALAACTAPGGDVVTLVKPQFEVGRDRIARDGVVRDPELRAETVLGVVERAPSAGLTPWAVVASPLPGPAGNVEYLLRLRRDAGPAPVTDWPAAVATAIAEGPS